VTESKTERHVRRNLRQALEIGGLENADAIALLHGTLAGYARRGTPVARDRFCAWADQEGWPGESLPVLRGIAYAADNATPNLGELTTTKAAGGALMVHLTLDEAYIAHAALREVLSGPYRVPDEEFHTLTGYRPDEAKVVLDALGDALRPT
jgi:hypothetical protein